MNNYDLSIVTVVKNDLAGLIKTIESIKAQKKIAIELVIVDGGSTDGSSEYAIEKSTVQVESKKDGGIYNGMHRGLESTTAEYVMFLNSGDSLNGELNLYGAIQSLKDTKSLWGFGPIVEVSSRGTLSIQVCKGDTSTESIVRRKTFVPFPTVIATKSVLLMAKAFESKFEIAEDFYTICKLSLLDTPIRWEVPLVFFAAGGVSYTKAPKAYFEEFLIQRRILGKSRFHLVFCRFLIKNLRWLAGQSLDFLYRKLPFEVIHWRDLKSVSYKVPKV